MTIISGSAGSGSMHRLYTEITNDVENVLVAT